MISSDAQYVVPVTFFLLFVAIWYADARRIVLRGSGDRRWMVLLTNMLMRRVLWGMPLGGLRGWWVGGVSHRLKSMAPNGMPLERGPWVCLIIHVLFHRCATNHLLPSQPKENVEKF
jgi:hypothetical protein